MSPSIIDRGWYWFCLCVIFYSCNPLLNLVAVIINWILVEGFFDVLTFLFLLRIGKFVNFNLMAKSIWIVNANTLLGPISYHHSKIVKNMLRSFFISFIIWVEIVFNIIFWRR